MDKRPKTKKDWQDFWENSFDGLFNVDCDFNTDNHDCVRTAGRDRSSTWFERTTADLW